MTDSQTVTQVRKMSESSYHVLLDRRPGTLGADILESESHSQPTTQATLHTEELLSLWYVGLVV